MDLGDKITLALIVVVVTLILVSCVHTTGCTDFQGNSVACLKAFNDKALKEHK